MTVTNPYYEFDPNFVPFTKARAGDNNNQFQAVQNAFDLLPGDADALTTDTAIFAPESGTGNAYIVTMPDTRTSNQDGDGVRFFATHTNTGAATLNIDAIGAIALVNWDGTVLVGNEIVSGRLYEVRYDATNVQYVLAATTDAALEVTYAQEWAVQAEDVPVSIAAGGDGATDFSSFHWAQKSLAGSVSGRVLTDINTATPPTTEGVTGAHEIWDADQTDLLQRLGFLGSNELLLKNYMHGGDFKLAVETAAGVEVAYKYSDTRFGIPAAVGVTFEDTGLVERESLILEAGSGGDTDFTSVQLLADGDGADGATSYTERSLNTFGATFVGNAQLDTAQFKFGTASFLLDGTGDYVHYADDPAFNLGSGIWTIEGWVRFNSFPAVGDEMTLVSQWSTSTGSDEAFAISVIQDGGAIRFRGEVGDAFGVFEQGSLPAGSTNTNQWYHFVMQRSAGDLLSLWFNGLLEFEAAVLSGSVNDSTETVKLGVYDPTDGFGNEGFLDGWLDDVRITIGVERYTTGGAITPPVSAFPTSGPADAFKVGSAAIQTVIRGSGGDAVQTIAAASGGLQINNALTGAGMERALTTSDISVVTPEFDSPVISLADIVTATPPVAEAVTGAFEIWDNDETDLLGRIGYEGNNDLRLRNLMHNGSIILEAENSAGTVVTVFEADPNSIVDITAATSLRLFIDGGNNAIIATGGAGVDLYHSNIKAFATAANAARIFTDLVTATPPTTEMVTAGYEIWDLDNNDQLARIGFIGSQDLRLKNQMRGGRINISGNDLAGIERTIMLADPDGVTILRGDTNTQIEVNGSEAAILAFGGGRVDVFYNDSKALGTFANGQAAVYSTGDLDTQIRQLVFAHNDQTIRGRIGHEASDILTIRNEIHLGEINIVQEDGAGTDVIVFSYDASSGQVELNAANVVRLGFSNGEQAFRAQVNSFANINHNNIEVVRTRTSALGGLQVSNTLTGSGAERVLTESDISSGINLGQVATGSTLLTGTSFVGVLNAGPAINTQHMVNCSFEIVSPAADDAKVQFALNVLGDTFKGTIVNSGNGLVETIEATASDTATNTVVIPTDGTATPGGTYVSIQGVLKKGANAGTFSLRVAKNTDTGADGLFAFGSGMVLLEIP